MTTLDEKIKVMQAYKDGKQIEGKRKEASIWLPCKIPCWDWYTYDFRIKEEPKKKVKLYKALCYTKNLRSYFNTVRYVKSIEEARIHHPLSEVIKLLPHTMIEVEED